MADDSHVSQKMRLLRRDDHSRILTAAEFRGLADVPPEVEWLANITNPSTRRAFQNDVLLRPPLRLDR